MSDPLTTALQGHNDIATSRREIKSATTTFRDLRPFREAYVYQNGARVEMCVLKGTIPVTYQNIRYNIPVSIWIPPDFPNRPPIPYVAPTPTMEIKVGKFVDRSGLVTLPYLVNWRHGTHNLYELISVLALQFGEESPVFARATPRPPPTPRPTPFSSASTRHNCEDQKENRRQQVLVNNSFEVKKVAEIFGGSGSKYDRLKELYKQFPPKMGRRLMELTNEEAKDAGKLGKCISLSIKHYHPDQNHKEFYGENWAVLSEEICKHLTKLL